MSVEKTFILRADVKEALKKIDDLNEKVDGLSESAKKTEKNTKKMGGSLIGTIIGASAGACSCGPIGVSVITSFGTAGSIASSFLTNYEIPLRLLSIGILILVLLTTMKSLSVECKINQ